MPFSGIFNRPSLLAGAVGVAVIIVALIYFILAFLLGLPPFSQELSPQANIQIVLDRSIAMEAPFGDGTKMEAAIRAIDDNILAHEVSASSNLAFRQYGGPCEGDNSRLLVDFGVNNQQDVRGALRDVDAGGETTFVNGIIQAIRDFGQADGAADGQNEIIVVAGGGDSCRLEEAAPRIRQEIEQLGIPVNIRFIGLNVPEDQRAALDEAALAISGMLPIYISSPIELDERLTQVVEDIAAGRDRFVLPPLTIPPTATPVGSSSGGGLEENTATQAPPTDPPPTSPPPTQPQPTEPPPTPNATPLPTEPPTPIPTPTPLPTDPPTTPTPTPDGEGTQIDDDDNRTILTVVKQVTNDNGGSAQVSDFTLRINGDAVVSGAPILVNPGTHTVSEDPVSGYASVFGGSCNPDGMVTLARGDRRTCIITNDDIAPTLMVIKNVNNNGRGPNDPEDFTISVTGSGATPATFPGDSSGTEVTLNVGPYSVGETPTAGYVQSFSAGCTGTLELGQSADCTITNEYIGLADLALDKTVSDPSPNGGETISYTLTLTNNGPDTANGIEVTDPLPTGVTFDSAEPGTGAYDDSTGVWSVGTLEEDTSATLTINGTVELDACGDTVTNTATVSAVEEEDPDSLNNSDSAEVTVLCADLVVIKTGAPEPVEAGSPLTYTITVTNSGPSAATGVTLTDTLDTLPTNVTFVSAEVDTAPGLCSDEAGTVTCDIGDLASGDSATVEIMVTPEAEEAFADINPEEGDDISLDSAPESVIPGALESDFVIEMFSERQILALPADLDLNISLPGEYSDPGALTPETIPAGEVVNSFLLHFDPDVGSPVSAEGSVVFNADILGVVLLDGDLDNTDGSLGAADTAYPTGGGQRGLELSVEGDTVTVSTDLRTLTVQLADGGETIDQLRVITAASLVNTAQVTGNETDTVPGNNTDTLVANITGLADLSVSKIVNNNTPVEGEDIIYTVTVSNVGPGAATGVEVTDQLPDGLVFESAEASRGTYDEISGLWTLGDLGSPFSSREFSDSATLTITATVDEGTAGGPPITNTAEVAAVDQTDPDSTPGNGVAEEDDQDSAEIDVASGPVG